MFMRITLALLLVVSLAAGYLREAAAIADPQKPAPGAGAAPGSAFAAFKKLAGDWVGKGVADSGHGEKVSVNFKVTAGGSAVVETELPGTAQEMVTIIHPDGNDLILTHYCHVGNQPQMRAPGRLDGKQVAFKFVRATNLKSEKDMHMRSVTYTFVDDDTLKAEWTLYQEGKPGGSAVFELKRKK